MHIATRRIVTCWIAACSIATLSVDVRGEEKFWSEFRGPNGAGVIAAALDLTAVGDPAKQQWRTPIRGTGWSSPVTDGQLLWISSAITTAASEEEKAKALKNVLIPEMKDVAGSVELLAIGLDVESGKVKWEKSLAMIDEPSPIHPMNSYASPTPVVIGERVVFHFGGYGTWCLDGQTGEEIWRQQLKVDDSVGPGSSPIQAGKLLIVACDGIDQQFVVGLSIEDGSIAWKSPRPPIRASNPEFQKAYSTPLVLEIDGKLQAIVPGAQWIVAYDPTDGREIWRIDHGDGFSVSTMPLYVDGLVVFATGYGDSQLVAVDPTGSGDVSATHVRWRQKRGSPKKPSLISDGKLVYVISDEGILAATGLDDGEPDWKSRIGGMFSASPVLSGNRVLIANHDGSITVFATGDEYREISSRTLEEQIMASPIPVGGDVILRTKEAIYRFKASR